MLHLTEGNTDVYTLSIVPRMSGVVHRWTKYLVGQNIEPTGQVLISSTREDAPVSKGSAGVMGKYVGVKVAQVDTRQWVAAEGSRERNSCRGH